MTSTRRLPADWELHASSILAWPGREEVWRPHLDAARDEAARLVQAIAANEPVVLAVRENDVADHRVQALLNDEAVSPMAVPLDDCWARDISPLFVIEARRVLAVQFPFNGWGERFEPHDNDRAFASALAERFDTPLEVAPLTLEGGAITTDGAGTAIAVAPTIINPNRNPGWSTEAIEAELQRWLGITRMVWLEAGLSGDTDTDGHVDNVAVFASPTKLICQGPVDTMNDADLHCVQTNIRQLRAEFHRLGKPIQIIEMPWLPSSSLDHARPSSYLNICFTNSAVLVPIVGTHTDELALDLYREVFRDRTVLGIPTNALAFGGGGLHCMTAHLPADEQ